MYAWNKPTCRKQGNTSVYMFCMYMQRIELGGREAVLKSVFSNGMSSTQLEHVRQYITIKLSFAKVATKTTASVHVKNRDLNTSLVVAFNRSGYAACTLYTTCRCCLHAWASHMPCCTSEDKSVGPENGACDEFDAICCPVMWCIPFVFISTWRIPHVYMNYAQQ